MLGTTSVNLPLADLGRPSLPLPCEEIGPRKRNLHRARALTGRNERGAAAQGEALQISESEIIRAITVMIKAVMTMTVIAMTVMIVMNNSHERHDGHGSHNDNHDGHDSHELNAR